MDIKTQVHVAGKLVNDPARLRVGSFWSHEEAIDDSTNHKMMRFSAEVLRVGAQIFPGVPRS